MFYLEAEKKIAKIPPADPELWDLFRTEVEGKRRVPPLVPLQIRAKEINQQHPGDAVKAGHDLVSPLRDETKIKSIPVDGLELWGISRTNVTREKDDVDGSVDFERPHLGNRRR